MQKNCIDAKEALGDHHHLPVNKNYNCKKNKRPAKYKDAKNHNTHIMSNGEKREKKRCLAYMGRDVVTHC